MEKCIEATKEIILSQVNAQKFLCHKSFDGYQKMYAFTNENIKSYLGLISESTKNALSILSSGDHAFNLISKGILNIDTFDTNRLTETYALGFKRAMILKYNFVEFKTVMSLLSSSTTSLETVTEIVYGLIPFMELEHQNYFRQILDYNYKLQIEKGTNFNLLELLTLGSFISEAEYYNEYLNNKESYNRLRANLSCANISFKYANALYLKDSFNKEYDVILLSNIMDYLCSVWGIRWKYDKLDEFEKSLEMITKDNGIIFLNYLFYYGSDMANYRRFVINSSGVRLGDLNHETIITLEKRKNLEVQDAILLKRVRKG